MTRHRYEVIRSVGSGGFGVVYLARYLGAEGFHRLVALKVLREELALPGEVEKRMRDEARILGLLRHRAIVAVDRLTTIGDRATIVMEYVEGANIGRILNATSMPVGVAVEIASEIASALRVGFETPSPDGRPLRMLHRDIKPTNVIVTRHGEVKVLDFGIARADFQGREAETGLITFGSPSYMPPERARRVEGEVLQEGHEGDVYSLGVILWEMLTRRNMGRAAPTQGSQDARIRELLTLLRAVQPSAPPELHQMLAEMLDFDPGSRPSAREVERRCLALLARQGDEQLRYWAERVVPPLLGEGEHRDPLGWTGRSLEESTGSGIENLPLPPDPSPSRLPRLAGAALGLALFLAPAAGVIWGATQVDWGGLKARLSSLWETPDPPPPAPDPEPEPALPVVEPLEPDPEPAPPEAIQEDDDATVARASPQSSAPQDARARHRPTRSRSGQRPSCPEGQIGAWFAGSAEGVSLTRSGLRTELPGCLVEGGLYAISVTTGGEVVDAGSALLRPASGEQEVKLECSPTRCKTAALD